MLDQERRFVLRRLLDQGRGEFAHGDLTEAAEFISRKGEELNYDDLAYIAQQLSRQGGSLIPPSYLCRFVAELLASREAISVLDPMAGEGWLAARVSLLSHGTQVQAVTDNPNAKWLMDYLKLQRILVISRVPEKGPFDAIVSLPVIGGQQQRITRFQAKIDL